MDGDALIPLTHAEKRIYLTQQLHPDSCMWNVPVSLRVTMADPERLHRALLQVIAQTPGLRVVFTQKDGEPRKYVSKDFVPPIERVDFSKKGEQAYLEWARQQAATPLPMLDRPPYRLVIADVGDGTTYLFTNYHHIAADGGASDLVFRRVLHAYEALAQNETPQFPAPLPLSAAYDSEQDYFRSERFKADKEYWNTLLKTVPDPMDIAGRQSSGPLTMDRVLRRFSPSTSRMLLNFCTENRVSPFRVVLAAMSVVLSRTLRRNDLVFGTATANRHPRELHEAFGMHVSTCAMRMDVDGEMSFERLVQDAARSVRTTVAHERYPYDVLASDLRARTGEAPDLLSCTLVEMVRTPYPDYAEAVFHHHGESLIPLAGFLTYPHRDTPGDTTVELMMVFNADMYEPWRVEALAKHVEQAVAAGVKAPKTQIRDLDFLSAGERRDLVHTFNKTAGDWEVETTLHRCVAEIARRHPGRTAVVHRGRSLTYAELNARADAMACTLQAHGAGPGQVVGLLADRSVDVIVAQLGILKSGCAFMPIDTGYPDSRIRFMLEDIEAPVILTRKRFMDQRDFGRATVLDMDDPTILDAGHTSPECDCGPHDPCVIIYTSGSTGKPKGVVLQHRSICNTINATIHNHGITPEDRISKHASFSFDASLLEVFTALMSGAALHIIPEEVRLSLSHLNEYFEKNGITWAFLTTQLGEQFMDFMDNTSLRTLAIGGEKMRIFKPRNYRLLNLYGPTECSIYATQHHITEFEDNLPIGRPLPNFRIYILDGYGHPQPPGYGGELCIGGPGVARGYHKRDDKNAECFVPDPFHAGETMYRTGDLACWTPEGTILHQGRMDRQVKLRGFRIELGEIENAMLAIDGVDEAAVADFRDRAGHVYLCGYICGDADPETVKQALQGRVPPFMIPAHMVGLKAMPINPSGKIDRKKLPEPEEAAPAEAEYSPPENDLEARLCEAWGSVLDKERISAEADFFQSGGDSLRAVALQLTIGRSLGRDVDLPAIFECPTPRLMAARFAGGTTTEAIPPAAPAQTYPATVSQQQLFLLNRMKGIGTTYNMPVCITFAGNLNRKRLSDALLALLERHEALRTAFEIKDGRCVQRVVDNVHLKLDFAQTAGTDPADMAADFTRPFDLSRPPLMHAKLLAHDNSTHSLLLDFHHIAFDGVSLGIFLRELQALYQGEELPPASIQAKDVAAWLASREEKIRIEHEAFWQELFETAPQSELPTDFSRSGHQDFNGATYRHRLGHDLSRALRRLARERGSTLHQIILGAIGILAGRWSDSEDICIGTSMSGRDRAETAGIVGMFVRTLPTRIRPENDKPFAALLAEMRDQMLSMHEHGEYPISSLYEHLGANRGPGRHPMFDINFVMRNVGAESRFDMDGLTAEVHTLHSGTAKFDLSIAAEEHGDELVLEMDYRTSLYRRETIARMAGHLCTILAAATENPDIPAGEMDMLGPEERDALLNRFSPQPTPPPAWPTVCRAIEAHAASRPDHVAVRDETSFLTYGQLNRLANRTARAIVEAGGGRDRIVAVVADRSVWSVCGMLAALKSGSAYVGLDTHYPPDRVAFILEDTAAPCVVGSTGQLAGIEHNRISIAMDGALPEEDSDPGLDEGGDGLAYCIFTSGSTGTPKGVLIEHRSMVNFIHWYATHHRMTPESGCAAFAAFSFDVSVVQVFAPLVSGSTLHVIAEDLRRSPKDLDAYFTANGVTHAHFPTQFAEQYMRLCTMDSLRHVVVGGDRLKSYRLGGYRLTNEYGPSETTMACLSYDVPEIMPKPPVGRPVANTVVSILDSRGRLCPIGVPGEICVSGIQVGRGYLNRPELTEKHFTEDPLRPGERMFRTGDKGKWLEDGTVDFIGRMDFQVKIRGYRVEPGEIEARIKDAEGVLDCVVVPLEDPGGNKVLAAYCTAKDDLDTGALRATLQSRLPEYMVPAHFVQLDRLPLNPNGKVDRGKLPRPEITSAATGPLEPRTPAEARIARAWENVLGHRGFGLFDSFYDIGGDSLSAIALLADLSETFDISASDLFAHTSIADQAQHFQEAETGRSTRLLRLKQLALPPQDDATFKARLAEYEAACKADAELDTKTVTSLEHVLLTGATGTLGIYLLRELLTQTRARITAVVRGEDDEAAHRRLADHYRGRFGRSLAADGGGRVTVLTGDLSLPGFDMEKTVYDGLEADVDTILHSAALTSHYGDWEVFRAANITSVENLADFARRGRAKAMHHVSTTSIGAGRIKGRTRALFTEFDVDMGQESGNLYVRSKLMAEIALKKLREDGLPVNVYRAGNITCDSQTGVFQRNVDDNAFYQQIRAYVNLGAAPDFTDVRNMSYVDQSAAAIVTIMTRPGLAGQTFHIQNPNQLALSTALGDDSLGLRLKRMTFDSFIDFFAEHSGCPGFDEYVERMLLHLGWQDWLSDPARTGTVIRVDRSADLLERCGFVWKTPGPDDLRGFVRHALQDRVRLLGRIPGFSTLNNEALTDIAARITPEYVPEAGLLQEENRPVDGVRFIMEGMAETYRHNASGWVGTVRVGGPGSCIGEEGVLEDSVAANSVESLDDSFVFRLSLNDVRTLTERHPRLGLSLLHLANLKTDQAERLFVAV
jgi:fengycin family lipopeptide synthetase D